MKKLVLYPSKPIVGIDFSGVKKHVVPNQSMTLKEIIRRFVKRESLPAEKQGIYHESDYDLEKVLNEDIVDRHEILEEIKSDVEVKRKKVKDEEAQRAAPSPVPPSSDPKSEVPPSAPPV